jgi:hypothetical protein
VYPVILDSPALPQLRQDLTLHFENDDGLAVEEVALFSPPAQFEITMTAVNPVDGGFTEIRRSTQLWVEGNPWWSRAAVVSEYTIDGQKSTAVQIAGQLIS